MDNPTYVERLLATGTGVVVVENGDKIAATYDLSATGTSFADNTPSDLSNQVGSYLTATHTHFYAVVGESQTLRVGDATGAAGTLNNTVTNVVSLTGSEFGIVCFDSDGDMHTSGHFLNITTWEVFNEPDYEHGHTPQSYVLEFGAIVAGIRRHADPEKKIQLMNEAQFLLMLDNPGIPRVHGIYDVQVPSAI